ncbi:MAG: RNA polymerase factor sigma-54 [Xanthomonadales bacterium]|nr:RNA polymerase factor sigma-54 [Xanthomonadales bacterium]
MPEQSLQLRLAQKLALAPQLQQAIRLLQLTRIELREYIQDVVESNPLLEHDDGTGVAEAPETATDSNDTGSETEFDSSDDRAAEDWLTESGGMDNWQDSGGYSGDYPEPQIADPGTGSLREHLLWQINLAQFSDTDAAIAAAVIYALDDDGFLGDDLDEIRASLAPDHLVGLDEVRAVLHRIQRMEPVGVASRDASECLRVQLSALPSGTPGADLGRRLARNYLDLVADNDIEALRKETGADAEDLEVALDLIRTLEPRPGARYDNRRDEYLVPDVYVRQDEGEWVVSLSPDNDPRLKLNTYYIGLLRQSGGEDADYLRGRLQEARWLLSSLELRNQTLLKVSQCIVEQQEAFLEHGETAMKPLILKDVSDLVGVHESTVSRATTRKYMLTPRGLFELKYFFCSHVRTMDGGVVSATAVKARMQVLIENEPHERPLSDQEISRLLKEAGIKVARRTVAKYRESLGIGASSERRRVYRRYANRGNGPAH